MCKTVVKRKKGRKPMVPVLLPHIQSQWGGVCVVPTCPGNVWPCVPTSTALGIQLIDLPLSPLSLAKRGFKGETFSGLYSI